MIIILMGVSGSGKTTVGQLLSQQLQWTYYDGDDFHSTENIEKMSSGVALTDSDRQDWLNTITQLLNKLTNNQHNAIISCSALKQHYREQLQVHPTDIQFVYLRASEQVIQQRLKARLNHFMHSDLLPSQFDSLEEPDNIFAVDANQSPQPIADSIQSHFALIP